MKKILVIGLVCNSYFYGCNHLPTKGETISANSLHTEIGGKGFNQAYTIYMLGGDVTFLTALGDDETGLLVQKEMNQLGIKTKVVTKKGSTAVASILTDTNGDNEVIVYPGVTLSIQDIINQHHLIEEADFLLLQLELPIDVTNYLIEEGSHLGKTIVLNPAPAVNNTLPLDKVHYLTPNLGEAKTLFGENYVEALLKSKVNAAVTLGEEGVLCFEDGQITKLEGIPQNVADTTGAGDVFNGVLAYYLASDESLINASKKANKLASQSVTKRYVIESIKSLV